MMMRPGLRLRVDDHRPRPQLFRAGAGRGDRRGAIHAGGLGRVEVEFAGMDDPNAVDTPSGTAQILHRSSPETGSRGARDRSARRRCGLQSSDNEVGRTGSVSVVSALSVVGQRGAVGDRSEADAG